MRLGPLLARKSSAAPAASTEGALSAARVRYRHWWWLPGWAFAAVTVLPALLAVAWLVPGFALLLAGRFTDVPMLIMFPALAIALCYFVLRQLPVSWPRFPDESAAAKRREPASRRPDVPFDALLITILIAAGYAVWQFAMNSESVLVTRDDAGVYLQYAYWIAGHGTAHISQSLAAFGGSQPGMSFASLGFYQTGTTITPSFMAGLPIVLSAGMWIGGIKAALVFGPVLGGCAVLTFAGLAGRLAGPRWAPAAALLLAVLLPEQYVSRATFSEPLTQILLFGGLCMVIDSMVVPGRRHGTSRVRGSSAIWQMRVLAAAGGFALGLSILSGIDALDYLVAVLPFLAILAAGRRPQAIPLTIGVVAGTACGLGTGFALARPFLDSLRLTTFGYVAAGVFAVSALGAALLLVPVTRRAIRRVVAFAPAIGLPRWRRAPKTPPSGVPEAPVASVASAASVPESASVPEDASTADASTASAASVPESASPSAADSAGAARSLKVPSLATTLPWVAAVIPVVALGLFLIRPYIQTLHNETAVAYVAGIQRLEGFRPDGTRSYAEDSLYWVIWYLGLPALLLGVAGLAMLTGRCSRALLRWRDLGGPARVWALPLLLFGWGMVTVLWAPDVTPDQPNASRRLVPVVLAGLIAAGVWVASRLRAHSRVLGAGKFTAGAAATCCVLAMAIPAAVATLGYGMSGNKVTLHGVAFKRVSVGELAAVRSLCGAIGPDASVIIVSPPVASAWSQVIRGMCGTPVVQASGASVSSLVVAISRVGRHPILLGSSSGVLAQYGGTPRVAVNLTTTTDTPSLVRPPQGESTVRYQVWMTAPDGQAATTSPA